MIIVAVAGLLIYRSSRLIGIPDIGEPFDLTQFGTITIDDAENAFADYDLVEPTRAPFDIDDVIENGWAHVTPEVSAWLSANRASLHSLQQGAAKPFACRGQPKDESWSTMISVTKHRALSRLALLEAARLTDQGDLNAAWSFYRAALRHSRHIGMYGAATDRLVSVALHATVSQRIVKWATDTRVDVSMLRQALRDISETYAMTAPASVTLRSEYFYTMNTLQDKLVWLRESEVGGISLFLTHEPTLGQRIIKVAYANWLSQADLPRYQQKPPCPGMMQLVDLSAVNDFPNISPSSGGHCEIFTACE